MCICELGFLVVFACVCVSLFFCVVVFIHMLVYRCMSISVYACCVCILCMYMCVVVCAHVQSTFGIFLCRSPFDYSRKDLPQKLELAISGILAGQ